MSTLRRNEDGSLTEDVRGIGTVPTTPEPSSLSAEDVFDQALAAVTAGIKSAKEAHIEAGSPRAIIVTLGTLESAIPDTHNPFRDQEASDD